MMLARLAKVFGTLAVVALVLFVVALPAAAFVQRTWLGRLIAIVTAGGLYVAVGLGLLWLAFRVLDRLGKE